jgi:hypothetical protein
VSRFNVVLKGGELIITNKSSSPLKLLEVRVGYRTTAEDYTGRPTIRTVTESTSVGKELEGGGSIRISIRSNEVGTVTIIYNDGTRTLREDLEP